MLECSSYHREEHFLLGGTKWQQQVNGGYIF